MADETPDLRIDAAAKLAQAGIVPSDKATTTPDAPRNPMTALTNEMAQCAVDITNEELSRFGGRKAFSPEVAIHHDDKNLQACIDNFRMNVREAQLDASNASLPSKNLADTAKTR